MRLLKPAVVEWVNIIKTRISNYSITLLTKLSKRTIMQKKINFMLFVACISSLFFLSCKKDTQTPVDAEFTVVNDTINGFSVILKNTSVNGTTYEWDFGDGSAVGTQTAPTFTYIYAKAGNYMIKLTAKTGSSTSVGTREIAVKGMSLRQLLAGIAPEGKTWNLEYNAGVVMINPANFGEWWYSWTDKSAFPLDQRNTIRHNQYIFKPNGSFEFKSNGFTIRPVQGTTLFTDVTKDSPKGWADNVSWTNGDAKDCSTWGNNSSLTFSIGVASKYAACKSGKITLNGKGGHFGPMDTGTDLVVDEPAASTYYEIYKYVDGGAKPDTLILFTPWGSNELGTGKARGAQIGRITLVSYKTPAQIPADEIAVVVGEKPLQANDISETFEAAGTMAWLQDNAPALFTEDFANPVSGGINTSAHVAKYQRGIMDYANLQFELAYRMNLSTRNTFKIKVYIDAAAAAPTVSLKLQDTKQGGNAWQTQTEVKKQNIATGEWVELTFDFSGVSTNTAYDKIVLQFGDEGANKGDGLFYFDDLILQ